MGLRLSSVRQRILLLVLVPVLSLIGLYAYSTTVFATQAINLARTNVLKNSTAQPAGNFYGAVGRERPLALVYLARPTADALNQLKAAEAKTQATALALKAALTSPGTTGNESVGEKAAISVLLADVAGLPAFNAQVEARSVSRDDAYNHYNKIISDGTQVINQAILQENDPELVTQSLALVRVGRSEEMLARELALLVSDVTAGSFPQSDRIAFTQLVGARRQIFAENITDLITQYQREYARVTPQDLAAIKAAENRIIASRGNRLNPALFGAFEQTFLKIQGGESAAASRIAVLLTSKATHDAELIYLRLFITGGLGLLAVIASLVVTFLLGRGLVRELAELRGSAEDLAGRRLPEVIQRLRDGEDVDTAEDDPAPAAKISEIRQVGEAFSTVRRTAVEAAVGEARLRRGISDIFRNLARRSQSLLHRQLALLDAMERRADKPDELEDLFRIDHLTTRMRRHAESLIILSGDAPARGWRNPVPLVDVIRAAVAEVEDYTRIKVTASTRAGLAGPAVGDVIHMIAELAENAAIFSPPNTPVLIGGDVVGRGFAIEIEDRGLGMSEEQRAEINERLANPPPFDLSGSDQLGLFVAGQLAKRHNVKISLRSSPYGGTTAIVLIPLTLVVPEGAFDEDQVQDERLTRRAGRHVAPDDSEGYPGDTNGLAASSGYAPSPGWPSAPESGRRGDSLGPLDRASAPSGTSGLMTAEPSRSGAWSVEPAAPAESDATSPGFGYPAAPELSPSAHTSASPAAGLLGSGVTGTASPGLEADGDLGDAELLPRRVRQASIAPQLRDDTLAAPVSPAMDAEAEETGEGRSPDEIRATMSAIQQGWQKGRSVFDPPDRGRGLTASDQDEAGSPAESSGIPGRPPGKK
ncbi:MAG TPA: nitrate- and nitrite sensing domain-containing protein [Streptosporangiaceae bacterium]